MTSASAILRVTSEVGLHARPAAVFVKTAMKYAAQIQVRNRTRDQGWVDAKSLLAVLSIAVDFGHEIEVQAEGDDAAEAILAIQQCSETGFTAAADEVAQRTDPKQQTSREGDDPAMKVTSVLESCLYVDDLDAAESFYGQVLGLDLISRKPDRHVFFRCGNSVVLLFNPEVTSVTQSVVGESIVPLHGGHGPGHLAFRAAGDELDAWKDHLAGSNTEIESDVHWPGGGRSIYFRDPAGNSIEIATPIVWGFS